jgi:hypothetical protein
VQEARGGYPHGAQSLPCRGTQIAATVAIDQDPDLDTARTGARECVNERASGTIGAEDVARERDTAPGRVDRGEHRRIALIAVAQDPDCIVVFHTALRDALGRELERGQVVGTGRCWQYPGNARRGAGGAQRPGPATYPVDAEQQVQQAAEHRGEPGEADPADRGGGLTLVQQHMDADPEGQRDVQQRQQAGCAGMQQRTHASGIPATERLLLQLVHELAHVVRSAHPPIDHRAQQSAQVYAQREGQHRHRVAFESVHERVDRIDAFLDGTVFIRVRLGGHASSAIVERTQYTEAGTRGSRSAGPDGLLCAAPRHAASPCHSRASGENLQHRRRFPIPIDGNACLESPPESRSPTTSG